MPDVTPCPRTLGPGVDCEREAGHDGPHSLAFQLTDEQLGALLGGVSDACQWCGRAIKPEGGAWIAVKGRERGYDETACDANPAGVHEPAGECECRG